MGISKFINSVKESLGLDDFKKSSKKKSVKNLLKKLNIRKEIITKSLEKKKDKKEIKGLHEELKIISLQLKKGDKILQKLTTATKKE